MRKAFVILILLVASGCAVFTERTIPSGYVGSIYGKYCAVHYRIDGNKLMLGFENVTTSSMDNLQISVTQRTKDGKAIEVRDGVRHLRMRQIHKMTIDIPASSQGIVYVTGYFVMTSTAPIPIGPGSVSDFEYENGSDVEVDSVSLRIF